MNDSLTFVIFREILSLWWRRWKKVYFVLVKFTDSLFVLNYSVILLSSLLVNELSDSKRYIRAMHYLLQFYPKNWIICQNKVEITLSTCKIILIDSFIKAYLVPFPTHKWDKGYLIIGPEKWELFTFCPHSPVWILWGNW